MLIELDSSKHIVVNNLSNIKQGLYKFDLNEFVDSTDMVKQKALNTFVDYFERVNSKSIKVNFNDNIETRLLLFISFFKFFYSKDFDNNFTIENDFFYGNNLKNYYWRLPEMNTLFKPFSLIQKDIFKEFYN